MSPRPIVVMSDDSLYLELMTELLAEEGYGEVRCVYGSVAVDDLADTGPALLLVDVPSWCPPVTLRDQIARAPDLQRVPLILCAFNTAALPPNQAGPPCFHSLEKPFSIADLLAAVGTCIGPP